MKEYMLSEDRELEQVQSVFQDWRRTGNKKGHIPEELWNQAIQLLKWFKPSRICKTLGLNQNDFNSRVATGRKATDQEQEVTYTPENRIKHPR